MASDFVQVQPDQAGKKVQTFKNTIGPDDVEAQAVVAVDPAGLAIALALDATLTGGLQKAIARGGAKGTTVAADFTGTPSGANHQGQDVVLYDAAGNVIDPRVIRALTATDVVTAAQGTAAAASGAWPHKWTDGTNTAAVKAASTAAVAADPAGVVSLSPNSPLPTGANTIGSVNDLPPTLTKGTQGSTGFSTQDLKDAGRVWKTYAAVFTAATTEALVTMTPTSDGTAGSNATTFAVTAGKRFRITSVTVTTRNAGAAAQGVVVNLRCSASGAITTSSPLIASCGAGTFLATANVVGSGAVAIPDGFEVSGTMQFGLSQVGTATAGNTATITGYEY